MPAIALAQLIDKIATGHPCSSTAPIQGSKQSKVTIGGNPVAVDGDLVQVHTIKAGRVCVAHPGVTVSATSAKMFINGSAVCRIGDPADGAGIITGQGKVMLGG